MMGTMANTLIFAYVGGSLSTLVVNYAYNLSYNQLINSYVIGTEIMQDFRVSLLDGIDSNIDKLLAKRYTRR